MREKFDKDSKLVENHIGAIKFFICHYNLEKAAALPVL
jgi:hypothetical protein